MCKVVSPQISECRVALNALRVFVVTNKGGRVGGNCDVNRASMCEWRRVGVLGVGGGVSRMVVAVVLIVARVMVIVVMIMTRVVVVVLIVTRVMVVWNGGWEW